MSEEQITKQKIVCDLKAVVADFDKLVRDNLGHLGEKAQVVREQVERGLGTVRVQVEDLERKARDGGTEAARATNDFVHEHPWEAIGVGLGAGLLVGLLIARR